MARFAGLKTPYALLIIAIMVLGIVATAFYFYNAANQNPCGDPGPAKFAPIPDQTIGSKTYAAVAANFTGTGQDEVISNVAFYTTALNDPSIAHLVNGSCASDPYTPASITVNVRFSGTGLQESLSLSFKGTTPNYVEQFTSDSLAGLMWNPGSISLILLVAK